MKISKIFYLVASCLGVVLYADNNVIKLQEVKVQGVALDNDLDRGIVVSNEEISQRGYTSLSQILNNTSDAKVVGGRIDMRGQGYKDGGVGSSRAIKLMIDGVDTSNMVGHGSVDIDSLIEVDEIDHIEIYPGGGAIRYGSGTRGGAINIIKKRPTADAASIYMKASTYGRGQNTGSVGADVTKIIHPHFGINANFITFNKDGFRAYTNDKGYKAKGEIFGDINGRVKYEFAYDYLKNNYQNADSMTQAQYLADHRYNTKGVQNTLKRKNFIGKVSSDVLDNLRLEAKGFYRSETNVQTKQKSHIKDEVKGGEITARYAYSDNGYLFFGYGFDRHNSLTAYSSGSMVNYIKDTHSLFAINEHKIGAFSLNSGLRFERADYTYNYLQKTGKTHTEETTNNFAFEFIPKYHYSDTGSIYAKYIRGFITPLPNEFRGTATDMKTKEKTYFIADLDPEIYDTFELGWADDLGFSTFDVSAFYTRTKDEIGMVGNAHGGTSLSYYYNVGKTDRYGLEFRAKQSVGNFDFRQNFTLLDTEIKSGNSKGKDVPYVSKFKSNLGASYHYNDKFSALVDANYNSSSKETTYKKVPGYVLVDVGVVYKPIENLRIKAGVKNLFDKKYKTFQSTTEDQVFIMMGKVYNIPGGTFVYPGDGRNAYLELKYTF